MHALETIQRLNLEATTKELNRARAAGRWVVATLEGLTVVAFTQHDDAEAAQADADDVPPNQGTRKVVYSPLTGAYAALVKGRDQSEDRTEGEGVVVYTQATPDSPLVRSILAA
jgi:hypothetical protein